MTTCIDCKQELIIGGNWTEGRARNNQRLCRECSSKRYSSRYFTPEERAQYNAYKKWYANSTPERIAYHKRYMMSHKHTPQYKASVRAANIKYREKLREKNDSSST